MSKRSTSRRPDSAAGFSLVELLVVFLIIAVTAGTALPSLLAFVKNYAISGAAQDVAREIQAARNRAIMRNVNLGVSVIIIDNTPECAAPPGQARCYRWIMEDDVDPQSANPAENWFIRQDIDLLLTDAAYAAQLGPQRMLPDGVFFDDTTATGAGVRFNRFGGWCLPDATDPQCPDYSYSGTDYFENTALGTVINIQQPSTQLTRTVSIGTGGRVLITPN